MNTIFKFYMPAWTLLHLGGVTLFLQVALPWVLSRTLLEKIVMTAVILFPFGFFVVVQPLRLSESAKQNAGYTGLKTVEQQYPGAEQAIKTLKSLPYGVVLEGQGDAYSWTTHVATLSEKPSYLGWVNHVRLLLPDGEAITKREQVTDRVYKDPASCEEIHALLKAENITYVVFGPREQERYGADQNERFSCLTVVVSEGRYVIYKP